MKNVLRIGPPGLIERRATPIRSVPSEVAVFDRKGGNRRTVILRAKGSNQRAGSVTSKTMIPLEEAQTAAKFICDELRKNRYLLSYMPINTSTYDVRRVFLVADQGIAIRTKNAQPPNIK